MKLFVGFVSENTDGSHSFHRGILTVPFTSIGHREVDEIEEQLRKSRSSKSCILLGWNILTEDQGE